MAITFQDRRGLNTYIEKFPIGPQENVIDDIQLKRAKIRLIGNLLGKMEINSEAEDWYVGVIYKILNLSVDMIPNISVACKNTGVSRAFVEDFSKIQYIAEHNSGFIKRFVLLIERLSTELN